MILYGFLQVNNANTGTIQLAQVQVEKGNYATDFEHKNTLMNLEIVADTITRWQQLQITQTLE